MPVPDAILDSTGAAGLSVDYVICDGPPKVIASSPLGLP